MEQSTDLTKPIRRDFGLSIFFIRSNKMNPKRMVKSKLKNYLRSAGSSLKNMFTTGKKGTTRGPARNKKTNTNTKDLQSKLVKKPNVKKKVAKDTLKVGTGIAVGYGIGKGTSKSKSSPTTTPKPRPKAKNKFGMGMVDSMSKARVKQGPPKPPAKKKKRSNITNSSSYDPIFASKVSKVKKKGMMTGSEMMQPKKDDGKAPMYEMGGTMGGVKKTKYAAKGMSGKKTKYAAKGMKMSKYYSSGGRVFSGR